MSRCPKPRSREKSAADEPFQTAQVTSKRKSLELDVVDEREIFASSLIGGDWLCTFLFLKRPDEKVNIALEIPFQNTRAGAGVSRRGTAAVGVRLSTTLVTSQP